MTWKASETEKNVYNIRYIDDIMLIAESEEKLQRIIKGVEAADEEVLLKINLSKTECMIFL